MPGTRLPKTLSQVGAQGQMDPSVTGSNCAHGGQYRAFFDCLKADHSK